MVDANQEIIVRSPHFIFQTYNFVLHFIHLSCISHSLYF